MTSPNRTRTMLLAGVGGVVAIGAALALFFAGDAPDSVDIDAALAQAEGNTPGDAAAEDSPTSDATSTTTTSGDTAVDPQGSWAVDTQAEPFDFASSAGTFLGFRVDEQLSGVGATTAVGRTPNVTGELILDGSVVTVASFSGDVAAITTDASRRDSAARSALGVDEHPTISFALTEPIDLGAAPTAGETFDVIAVGELTINGVTKMVEAPLQAALSSTGLLIITSSFELTLADYDVEAPKAGNVISVSDVATVEVQLYLAKA